MAIVQSDGALASGPLAATRIGGGTGQSLTWYSGLTQDYASIYRTQPNIRTVVSFFARNIAQLGLNVFERVADSVRESLGDEPIGELIRNPNEVLRTTHFEFIQTLVSDLKIYDEFFILKMKNPQSGKLRLFRLDPSTMEPVDGNPFQITKWRWLGAYPQPVFGIEDLIFHHGYNPNDPRRGLSPLEAVRQILAEDIASGQYREQFWQGGARISGVIERPATGSGTPKWSPDAKDRFLAEWKANFTGNSSGAGGTPLLEDGMVFKQVAFSAKDSEYIAARRLSREESAAVYHLSPIFVGILENANFSNVKEQHKHLYQDAFGPDLTALSELFQAQLIPEFPEYLGRTVYFEFDLKEKLKGDFEQVAAANQAAVGGPYKTRNEARADDNLPPIDGGDELITPLNVITGGQASPQDSAPGTNSRELEAGPLPKARAAEVKAVDELPDELTDWFEAHQEKLEEYFSRQENSVVAALAAGRTIESIFSDARWDRELKADLLELANEMTLELGSAAAVKFDGEFDPEAPGVSDYLDENTRIAAEGINGATRNRIAELEDDDSFIDNVAGVFAVAAASRAVQIATSRVTNINGFATREGSKQGGATKKVWRVRSVRSRHPRMNGETVDIDDEFSIGGRWPGDSAISEDNRVGCVCDMTFE